MYTTPQDKTFSHTKPIVDKRIFIARKVNIKERQPHQFIHNPTQLLTPQDKRLKRQVLKVGKEIRMKYLITLFVLAQIGLFARSTQAQITNWDSSPMNFQNSTMNFDNSPMNFQNSPMNFQNSPMNYNSTNGLYDNNGNRMGYEVQAPSGVTNYFDNNGNRIGYSPAQGKR